MSRGSICHRVIRNMAISSIGLALVSFFTVMSVNAQPAVDTEPPTILNCPQPSVSYQIANSRYGKVEFMEPTAYDTGSGIQSEYRSVEPPYPHFPYVPIGRSVTITYTFTDNSDNVATCEFTRIVLAKVTDIWCLQNTCLNGGACTTDQLQNQQPYCLCLKGYYGEFCQLEDNEPPVVRNCPAPQVTGFINEGSYNSLVSWREPDAIDETAVNIVKTQGPLTMFEAGPTEVVYTFTDEASNTAYCRFIVNIYVGDYILYDGEAPTIYHCPANQVIIAIPPGETQTVVGWQEPWAKDNSGRIPQKESSKPSMSMFPLGRTPVEYVFTDDQGNSATCNFDVILINEDPPTVGQNEWEIVDCPSTAIMANVPANEDSVIVDWNEPKVVGVSGQSVTVTKTHPPMASFPRGGTEVVYTFRSADGAQEECRFTIFITPGIDKPPPPVIADPSLPPVVINCPTQIRAALPIGTSEAIVNYVEPQARSPSNKPVLVTKSAEPGLTYKIRTVYRIVYTFTDSDGLSSSCEFEILLTVGAMSQSIPANDDEDPKVYNCPDNIETTTQSYYKEATVTWDEPWATDNTRITPDVWKTHQPLDRFQMGRTQVEYRFVDLNGNTAACSFTVDINVDNEPPRFSNCPSSFTVPLTTSNHDYIRLSYAEPVARDNDGMPPTVEQTYYPGDALPFGVSVVSYTFTDQVNNQAVCSFDITVTAPDGTTACAGGAQPIKCVTNPCRGDDGSPKSCPAQPDAECRANYCGGCKAVFYDTDNNIVDCYVKECTHDGISYGDFKSLMPNRCSSCICFSGRWYCRSACDDECPLIYPGDFGICDTGNTPFRARTCSSHDDCNAYDTTSKCCPNTCDGRGTSRDYCTKMPGSQCQDRTGAIYENEETLSSYDQRTVCSCRDGDWLCQKVVFQCTYNDVLFLEGDSRLAEDGCNRCFCEENGWSCTEIACENLRRNRRSIQEN